MPTLSAHLPDQQRAPAHATMGMPPSRDQTRIALLSITVLQAMVAAASMLHANTPALLPAHALARLDIHRLKMSTPLLASPLTIARQIMVDAVSTPLANTLALLKALARVLPITRLSRVPLPLHAMP